MSQPLLNPLEIEDLLNQYRSDLRKLEYQIYKTQTVIQELEQQAAEAQKALSLETAKALPGATKEAKKGKAKTGSRGPGRPPQAKAAPAQEEAAAATGEVKETAPAEEMPQQPAAKRDRKAASAKKGAPKKKKGPGRPRKSAAEKKGPETAKKEKAEKGDAGYRLSDWDKFIIESLKTKQQALITQDFLDIAKDNPDIKSGEAQIKVKLNRSLHKLANRKGVLAKVEHSGRGYAYALNEWVNAKGALPKKYAR